MRRLLLALLLAVAGAGSLPAPATAASGYCTGGGASVVIDYGRLGGGIQKLCGAPGTAAEVFRSAGVSLGYNQRMGGGYVCTVDGRPTDHACTGTDSYWALFLGKPGEGWVYTSMGANSQPVKEGQTIAFAWQSSNGKRTRGVAPAAAPAVVEPTKSATSAPTKGSGDSSGDHDGKRGSTGDPSKPESTTTPGAPGSVTASASATPSGSPSASPSAKAEQKHKTQRVSAAPSSGVAADATSATVTDSGDSSDDGLPWWVPVGVVVLLAGGGGAVAWRRSRAGKVT